MVDALVRPRRVRALATWVDEVSRSTALAYAAAHLGVPRVFIVSAVNPEKCLSAGEDPTISQFLTLSDLLLPDGIGVVVLCRLLGATNMRRVTGCDFALDLVALVAARGGGVFLVGASEESSAGASAFLVSRFGKGILAGRLNGYQDLGKGVDELAAAIKYSGAAVILVALGSPRQEQFINRVRVLLDYGVIMGVGGTFDVWSGKVPRAPEVFQSMGLEWLFRLLRQPARILRQSRLLVFAGKALVQLVRAKCSRLSC